MLLPYVCVFACSATRTTMSYQQNLQCNEIHNISSLTFDRLIVQFPQVRQTARHHDNSSIIPPPPPHFFHSPEYLRVLVIPKLLYTMVIHTDCRFTSVSLCENKLPCRHYTAGHKSRLIAADHCRSSCDIA